LPGLVKLRDWLWENDAAPDKPAAPLVRKVNNPAQRMDTEAMPEKISTRKPYGQKQKTLGQLPEGYCLAFC